MGKKYVFSIDEFDEYVRTLNARTALQTLIDIGITEDSAEATANLAEASRILLEHAEALAEQAQDFIKEAD